MLILPNSSIESQAIPALVLDYHEHDILYEPTFWNQSLFLQRWQLFLNECKAFKWSFSMSSFKII